MEGNSLMQRIEGRHPYEERKTTYDYIGKIEDSRPDGGPIYLYNTDDGHTVCLDRILRMQDNELGRQSN